MNNYKKCQICRTGYNKMRASCPICASIHIDGKNFTINPDTLQVREIVVAHGAVVMTQVLYTERNMHQAR